jgi:curved DNA-binding protein CbpA
MTLDADPYRTLGLARGATIDDVKRAYRRLAKANHPDAAGASALPRFLAIQAAYEQLVEGKASGNGRRPGATPRRPWDADPTRADATRRAYGSRPRPTTPGANGPQGSGSAQTGTAGAAGPGAPNGARPDGGKASWSTRTRTSRGPKTSGAAPGGPGADGAGPHSAAGARPGEAGGTAGGSRRRSDRPSKKATLGSTSYDGVDGPFEPDWGGASWYGTTSGTYWTLNPKEYADPR